jgi:isopentenyldiphosphate isomerase
MEYWDVYDVERIKTGRTIIRGEAFQPGDLHLVVHVCLFNSEGKMLIQQRQSAKVGWPDMWDISVGGSALKGDDSQGAASREVQEELGLALDFNDVRPSLTINFENGFDDIYLLEKDVDLNQLKLCPDEVQDVDWASREEILDMMEKGIFIPYFPSFISLLFDMRQHMGAIQQLEKN